jgi:Zn-finger nucleic acid-binding protein
VNCPVCDRSIIALELDQVEVDHCVHCGGVWLDAGELELLLDGAENRDRLLASMREAGVVAEPMRRCPLCDRKMQKVVMGIDGQVMIDTCARDHGLWLDGGELARIVKMGRITSESRVVELLREVFGAE